MTMTLPGGWFLMFFSVVTVKATALLALAFAACAAGRQTAAVRHWIWTISFAGLGLLPLLMLLLPAMEVVALAGPPVSSLAVTEMGPVLAAVDGLPRVMTVDVATGRGLTGTGSAVAVATAPRVLAGILASVWLAGALLMLARLLVSRLRAGRLVRPTSAADSALWPTDGELRIRGSDEVTVPCTLGVFRPIILVPASSDAASWNATWRRAAVAHERAHVERRDPIIQLMIELVRSLYWFHPLVWRAARRAAADREMATDDAVLRRPNESASEYASLLLHLALSAGRTRGSVGLAMVTRNTLPARVTAILDPCTPRQGLPPARRWLTAFLVCGALVPGVAMATVGRSRTALPDTFEVRSREFSRETRSGFIVGRVVDAGSGRGLPGAEIDLLTETSTPIARTMAGEDGEYSFGPLPRQRGSIIYGLYARAGALAARQRVHVPSGARIELPMALAEKGVTVSGRVLDETGSPVPGARLGFGRDHARELHPGLSAATETDATGRYAIAGVLPGDYVLFLLAERHADSKRRVAIGQDDVPGVDFVIPRMAVLSGKVVDEAGNPVPGATVHIRFWLSGNHYGGSSAYATADGSFRQKGMPSLVGTRVWAAENTREVASPKPLTIGTEGSEGLQLIVVPGAYISGVVRTTAGRPAAGVHVGLRDHRDGHRPMGWPPTSDASGRFRLGPLPAGAYEVAVDFHVGRPSWRDGPSVRNVRLASGETVTGIELVTPDRRPAAGSDRGR
jgi:beta-lactamase regulating signal transducer with metallopeptidase domain